jgi:16S rRNA (uracil1498-N3)-methyltransferase
MRTIRLYHPDSLTINREVILLAESQHHLRNVLRAQVGDAVVLFNGDGHDYLGTLVLLNKHQVIVQIHATEQRSTRSPLKIHLAQGINRGEKMDWVIQKATELGVQEITPLMTEYSNVKLENERWEKKLHHWQKIADNACEQSGRTDVLMIYPPITLTSWLTQPKTGLCFLLDPGAQNNLSAQADYQEITLLAGPEGGFSHTEVTTAQQAGFQTILLGPRILRSETAGLVAISICQYLWGDLCGPY